MTGRAGAALAALLLMACSGSAGAADEPLEAHGKHASRTVVLDNEDVRPSDTTMARNEVLVFQNAATQPAVVTFIEPADLQQRIRCGLLEPSADEVRRAPWLLFGWRQGKLVATVPPGRFASVCSLAPGKYAFTVERQGVDAKGTGGVLPEKGTITVQ
jgi:hypothetical protein